uniref:porin n=1 Tax=Aliarcobacter sp. TaxID=2321116 RepID=UPI00404795DB
MKKIAKLSLVAAVAVAGLTTANAQPLEEAIKNVDVSGTVVYRYDDKSVDNGASTSTNNYKVGVSLKSKVTDDVTFNSRVLVADAKGGFATGSGQTTGLDNQAEGDANPTLALSHANFAYTGVANTTLIVGKQGLATPWTNAVDSDGSEQTGTGILGLTTMGPVTAAAGYFNQTNITTDGNDLGVAGLIANFAGIKAEAWYLDIADNSDSYVVKASSSVNVGDVKLGGFAQYSSKDEDANDKKLSLMKAGVNAKMGIFDAGVTYAKTGRDGSGIVNNLAPVVSAIGYSVNLEKADDASAFFVDLGAQVLPKLHIGLNYDRISDDSADNANDHQETYAQFTYAHAKNLSAYVRLATGEQNKVDYNRGRLQVEYKF